MIHPETGRPFSETIQNDYDDSYTGGDYEDGSDRSGKRYDK